jgi:hypothetical protein
VSISPEGDIVVSGGTESDDMPLGAHPLRSSREARDGFFVQLTSDLTHVNYGTYVGGNGSDDIRSMWMSETGQVALVGSTGSTDYPAVNALQSGNFDGNGSVVVTLLSLE